MVLYLGVLMISSMDDREKETDFLPCLGLASESELVRAASLELISGCWSSVAVSVPVPVLVSGVKVILGMGWICCRRAGRTC